MLFTFPVVVWHVWQILDLTFEWVLFKSKSLWMKLQQFQKIYGN